MVDDHAQKILFILGVKPRPGSSAVALNGIIKALKARAARIELFFFSL
ncbi:hypothetical protein [Massilia eurypsychrophila]|jgi:hypothetical protein|nr:hypothetical protein [Massilia eurypsychrophila]